MRISFDKGKDTIAVDLAAILASSSEQLDIDLRDGGALLRLSGSDALKVTAKLASNLAPGAELFTATFGPSDLHQSSDTYQQFVNYNTPAMVTALSAKNPAELVFDVQYIPASGPKITSQPVAVTATQPVSSDDDGTPVPVPNADGKYLRIDAAQSFTPMAAASALADADGLMVRQSGQTKLSLWSAVKTWIKAWIAKADVGLGNVTNTSDADKPVSTAQQAALDLKASLASPTFTGTPAAPTATGGTNSAQLATTAFVKAAIDDLIAGAPGALDTLKEISDQLANDESAVSALTTAVAGKAPATRSISASGLASGGGNLTADRTIDVPAASQAEAEAGTNNTKAMTPLRAAQAIAALASGGGSLSRGKGVLQGWTSYTAPAAALLSFHVTGANSIYAIAVDGVPVTYTFADEDPADGSIYLGPTSTSPSGDATTLAAAIASNQGLGASGNVDEDSGRVDLNGLTLGAAAELQVAGDASGSGFGTDAVGPSGQVIDAQLVAGATGKANKVVGIVAVADDLSSWNGVLSIKYGDGTPIMSKTLSGRSAGALLLPEPGDTLDADVLLNGVVGQALHATFEPTDSDVLAHMSGGALSVVAVCSQE